MSFTYTCQVQWLFLFLTKISLGQAVIPEQFALSLLYHDVSLIMYYTSYLIIYFGILYAVIIIYVSFCSNAEIF